MHDCEGRNSSLFNGTMRVYERAECEEPVNDNLNPVIFLLGALVASVWLIRGVRWLMA